MELEDAVFTLEYDGEDFTIPLHDNSFMLRGCEWRPEGSQPPDFVVIYVHGLGSFLTTKHDVANIIVANGGVFMGCDHLGCGRSPGFRSSCTIEEICQETEHVIQKAKESFPDIPIFLFGHSMGALASLRLIFEQSSFVSQNLRGVIIEAPWISNSKVRPITFLQSIGIMLAAKFTPLTIFSTGDEQYSSDLRPDFVEKVLKSPLFSPFTTPRLLDSALRSITFVRKSYNDWPADLPVLFLQGGADTHVDPVANEAWFKDVQESMKDLVDYKIYPKASHHLFKGLYRGEVLQDVLKFIANHKH